MKKYKIISDNKKESIVEYNCERAVVSTFEILNTTFEHYRSEYPKDISKKIWDTIDYLYKYLIDEKNNEFTNKDLNEMEVIIRAIYKK